MHAMQCKIAIIAFPWCHLPQNLSVLPQQWQSGILSLWAVGKHLMFLHSYKQSQKLALENSKVIASSKGVAAVFKMTAQLGKIGFRSWLCVNNTSMWKMFPSEVYSPIFCHRKAGVLASLCSSVDVKCRCWWHTHLTNWGKVSVLVVSSWPLGSWDFLR